MQLQVYQTQLRRGGNSRRYRGPVWVIADLDGHVLAYTTERPDWALEMTV